LVIFGINLPSRGILPISNIMSLPHSDIIFFGINLSDFYKIWLGEGVPGPHLRAKVYRSGLKNVGLQPQKSQKNRNFWYKFAPKVKFRGSTEKAEYDTIR